MEGEAMAPMPDHINQICMAYSVMLAQVGVASVNTELSPAQAITLMQIGDERLTATEMRRRGLYHGSNMSYTIQRLEALGYIHRHRAKADCRKVYISLTEDGLALCDQLRKALSKSAMQEAA